MTATITTTAGGRTNEERKRRALLLLTLCLLAICLGEIVGSLAFPRAGEAGEPAFPSSQPPRPRHAAPTPSTASPVHPAPASAASGHATGKLRVPVAFGPYTIAGKVTSSLYPGAAASPITITFDSPAGVGGPGTPVSKLTVSILSVTGGGPGPNRCTPADFALTQIPAAVYPFVVPAGVSRLVSLIGPGNLPSLRMLDRHDTVPGDNAGNQDSCRGATVKLGFVGTS